MAGYFKFDLKGMLNHYQEINKELNLVESDVKRLKAINLR
jgi:hypothetical protein